MATQCIFCGAAKDATLSTEAQVDCCTSCVWKYTGPPVAYCITARAGAWCLLRKVTTMRPYWHSCCDAVLDGAPFIDATKFATFKDMVMDADGHLADIEKRRF